MVKRLTPSTHSLQSHRNRGITSDVALSESIDNSLTALARKIDILIGRDKVSVTDNGHGLRDLDLLIGIGHSGFRGNKESISRYGIGSIDMQLHFGSKVHIQSVNVGRYYERTLDWDHVETSGLWPEAFSGRSRPGLLAPEPIRKQGLMLTISRLADRPRINMEVLVKRLSHRYRPALERGIEINIIDARRRGAIESYKLTPSLPSVRAMTTVSGLAADKAFTLSYSSLKEHDPFLAGIHIAFSDRFILHVTKLGSEWLPGGLYGEVMLSPEWKECLSPNKTDIVKDAEPLALAVYELLKDWIAKLQVQAEHVRIEHINLALKSDIENVFIFDPTQKGRYGKGSKIETTGGGGASDPNPHVETETAVEGAGEGGTKERKRRPGGIGFVRDDGIGQHQITSHEMKGSTLIIKLNGRFKAIEIGYQPPYKPIALWPHVAHEIAKFVRDNAAKIEETIPGLIDGLNKLGYAVSAEYPDQLAEAVYSHVMRQVPLDRQQRSRVSKLQEAVA